MFTDIALVFPGEILISHSWTSVYRQHATSKFGDWTLKKKRLTPLVDPQIRDKAPKRKRKILPSWKAEFSWSVVNDTDWINSDFPKLDIITHQTTLEMVPWFYWTGQNCLGIGDSLIQFRKACHCNLNLFDLWNVWSRAKYEDAII